MDEDILVAAVPVGSFLGDAGSARDGVAVRRSVLGCVVLCV